MNSYEFTVALMTERCGVGEMLDKSTVSAAHQRPLQPPILVPDLQWKVDRRHCDFRL